MNVDFSGKNLALTDALRGKVEKKIAKLERFTGPMVSAHVSLQVERRVHHVELMVHCTHDRIYKARAMAEDMYMAITEAADAIGQQAKKEKGRRLSSRGRGKGAAVPSGAEEAPEEEVHARAPERGGGMARRRDLFLERPMSAQDAALVMDELRAPLVVFRDARTDRLSVLFRDAGGGLGLIEAPGRS